MTVTPFSSFQGVLLSQTDAETDRNSGKNWYPAIQAKTEITGNQNKGIRIYTMAVLITFRLTWKKKVGLSLLSPFFSTEVMLKIREYWSYIVYLVLSIYKFMEKTSTILISDTLFTALGVFQSLKTFFQENWARPADGSIGKDLLELTTTFLLPLPVG